MAAIAAKVDQQLDALQLSTAVDLDGTKMGEVRMGFSRKGVQSYVRTMIVIVLAVCVAIVGALSAMVYGMVHRMVVIPRTGDGAKSRR